MLDTTPTSSARVARGTTDPDPDRDLVDAWVSQSDPGAFERLVERHQDYVFRVVLSVLGPAFGAAMIEPSLPRMDRMPSFDQPVGEIQQLGL